jgi:hypothetical protein
MPGIHGNNECVRCGACCGEFFEVSQTSCRGEKMIIKEEGKVCEYLQYDFKTEKASCSIYEDPSRCDYCGVFKCWEVSEDREKIFAGLLGSLEKLKIKSLVGSVGV